MRVGLDKNAIYTTEAGTARYIRGLLKGLRELNPPDLEILEVAWTVENLSFRQPQRALKTLYRELVWSKLVAPSFIMRGSVDVFHSTANLLVIPPRGVKHIATLHDLAVIRHPERFRPWHRWSGRKYLKQLHKLDRVICISQFTAREAATLLNLPRAKLEVVYNGCDFHPNERPPTERAPSVQVPDEFFLFLGSLEPGKNLSLLKDDHQVAEREGIALPPLVVVGVRWSGLKTEGRPPQNWRYLGRQPDDVLVFLFRRALALLFPSKYEGFGLPVVEAMTLGCPVICSPVASLPEIGGNAVLFTELNPAAYLQAIRRLLEEADLREELVRRGFEQSPKFSWKRCATETLCVYREA